MGVLVGLLLGLGAFCVWWSAWVPSGRPRRVSARRARTQDLLVQAGAASVTPGALYGASAMLAAVVLVTVLATTRSPAIGLCFALMAAAAPSALVTARARRRRRDLREVWPEVVDHLASGVRAGLSLPEAVGQLGERGPVELREPFARFAADYRATGRFAESLDLLKARLADPVADRIIEALRLTREVGGSDLGRLLRTLSTFLREDARNAFGVRYRRRQGQRIHLRGIRNPRRLSWSGEHRSTLLEQRPDRCLLDASCRGNLLEPRGDTLGQQVHVEQVLTVVDDRPYATEA
ncbi:type II secretion system F family protein [Xylanimonas protaetiae]|uniref:type II secretion system F family protein n=1 Tax=Xylanimonas protaetiae TaxID=2509457 RepID=UPI001F5C59E1|nr:type II secretion system F family protein [Xylanimonas protaetiae]